MKNYILTILAMSVAIVIIFIVAVYGPRLTYKLHYEKLVRETIEKVLTEKAQ